MLNERHAKLLLESVQTVNVIEELKKNVKTLFDLYSEKETFEILNSLARVGEPFASISKIGRKVEVNWNIEHVVRFIKDILIPNTVLLDYKDRDVIELLMFSMEFAFSMLEGNTKATKTQKGFRERNRDVETVMVNTFVGLIGEVGLRKFLKDKFNVEIELDRSIGTDISKYKSDIVNSKKPVSIKTTPNLKAVWAECPVGYDVGIFVKASVPEAVFINALAQVCAFRNLVEFSKQVLGESHILKSIEHRLYYDKCGAIKNVIKCFICGYIETKGLKPVEKGETLPYLGEVRESRYILEFTKLKSTEEDWKSFVERFLS